MLNIAALSLSSCVAGYHTTPPYHSHRHTWSEYRTDLTCWSPCMMALTPDIAKNSVMRRDAPHDTEQCFVPSSALDGITNRDRNHWSCTSFSQVGVSSNNCRALTPSMVRTRGLRFKEQSPYTSRSDKKLFENLHSNPRVSSCVSLFSYLFPIYPTDHHVAHELLDCSSPPDRKNARR